MNINVVKRMEVSTKDNYLEVEQGQRFEMELKDGTYAAYELIDVDTKSGKMKAICIEGDKKEIEIAFSKIADIQEY